MTISSDASGVAGPQAIIGTIGDIDSYQLPDSKGYTAFMRHVLKISDEERQQRREQVLATTLKDFRYAEQSHAVCLLRTKLLKSQPLDLTTKPHTSPAAVRNAGFLAHIYQLHKNLEWW